MSPRATRFDVFLRIVAGVAALVQWVVHPLSGGMRGDFLAMLSHRDHLSGYWDGAGFGYGPIFALYDLLLRPLSDAAAMRAMFAANLGLTLLGLWALRRAFPLIEQRPRHLSWLLLAIALFYPFAQLLRQNNVELTEACMLAWFVADLRNQRPARAGVFLGLAAATKYLPIVLVVPLLWRRQWRVALAAVTTFTAVVLLVSAAKGIRPLDGFDSIRRASGSAYVQTHASSQSLAAVLARLGATYDPSTEESFVSPNNPYAEVRARYALALSGLIITALAVVILRRTGGIAPRQQPALIVVTECALGLLLVLLALPVAHTHYFGLLLFCLPLVADTWGQLTRVARVLACGAYCLLGPLALLRLLDPVAREFGPATMLNLYKLANMPFLGATLAAATLVALHRRLTLADPQHQD